MRLSMLGGSTTYPLPMDNGLSNEQNQIACQAIHSLKVHELSAIAAQLGVRKPRGSKNEQQKCLLDSLYDVRYAQNIYQMAVQYNSMAEALRLTNSKMPPQKNQMQQKRATTSQNRHQPYSKNALNNQVPNNHYQQHHQNMIPQLMQIPQQMHQSMTSIKYHADRFVPIELPFYDVITTILEPVELHAFNGSTKQSKQLSFHFPITQDQVNKISYRPEAPLPRYEIQLRFFNLSETCTSFKDDFPLNCHARVDDAIVQLPNIIPTNKPNAEPKRPSRPVNITPCLNRYKPRDHSLFVEWLADRRVWAAGIYFVYRVNSDMLFNRLETNANKHRAIELTRQEIIKKLSGGEDDIAMDQLKTSLLDPLSKVRMKTPVRCQDCTHLQCFDLMSYLMMNERKPTWQCPVCSGNCPYNRLIVEDYFLDMLAKVDGNTTEVELKKDGSYDVIKEEADVCLSDDDDEEDVKSFTNGAATSSNGAVTENGGKKKKLPVADDDIITLSDDDDVDLNRGIQNSLSDIYSSDKTESTDSSQKSPPRKKGKDEGIEIITLDDSPPRPIASAMRQVSQQNLVPCSSSSANGSVQSSNNQPQNIKTALENIGGNNSARSSHSSQPSPSMQQQVTPHSMAFHQSSYMNVGQSSGPQTPTSQYGYSTMMQQHYTMGNGLIGRNNQMVHMSQHPQQPPQQMMSPQYFNQQQMPNGNNIATRLVSDLHNASQFVSPPLRFVDNPPPGVTIRNPRRPNQ
uniref:E3 SUMO-protein ligase gei-17 n=1 Tax=Caenorhabditis tropicalis TaxID=1561998 RepID=A0A1I7T4F9_9PELO